MRDTQPDNQPPKCGFQCEETELKYLYHFLDRTGEGEICQKFAGVDYRDTYTTHDAINQFDKREGYCENVIDIHLDRPSMASINCDAGECVGK